MALPRLHLVTDDEVLSLPDFLDRAREAAAEGGARLALHLRGPATSGRRLWTLGEALLPICRDAGALLFVNDRVDVAAALGADGVQLGARSLPPGAARAAWRVLEGPRGPGRVGRSVHGPDEVRELGEDLAEVDFLLLGTLFGSRSHPGRPAAGIGLVEAVVEPGPAGGLPVVGIGGIDPARVGPVMAAGAHGVAVLGGVWWASDHRTAVRRYLRAIENAGGGKEDD